VNASRPIGTPAAAEGAIGIAPKQTPHQPRNAHSTTLCSEVRTGAKKEKVESGENRTPVPLQQSLCNSSVNDTNNTEGGAESGALIAGSLSLDPQLAQIVEAWPKLPEAVRVGILALVDATEGQYIQIHKIL